MRKYKKNRAKKRSPYETYSYWYDKYTKGDKQYWFLDKLTEDQFNIRYNSLIKNNKRAKEEKDKVKNPAKTIAAQQIILDRKFFKQYKKRYGKDLGDIRSADDREQIYIDYINEINEERGDYNTREDFEKYFY